MVRIRKRTVANKKKLCTLLLRICVPVSSLKKSQPDKRRQSESTIIITIPEGETMWQNQGAGLH
jgi:hypothetical protein